MFIAWILFVGIATVLARHYKTGCGASKMLDNKVWLQVDVIFMQLLYITLLDFYFFIFPQEVAD